MAPSSTTATIESVSAASGDFVTYLKEKCRQMAKPAPSFTVNEGICLGRESYVSSTCPKIFEALKKEGLSATSSFQKSFDDDLFTQFCSRVQGYYHYLSHNTCQTLLQDFCYFDPADDGKRLKESNFSEEEIKRRQDRMLDLLDQLLRQANFIPLDKHMADIASEQRYLIHLPVELDKQALDSAPFKRFLERHSDQEYPDFAESVLLFRRGTGIDRTEDFFAIQKVEILMSRLVNGVMRHAAAGIMKLLGDTQDAEMLSKYQPEYMKTVPEAPKVGESIPRVRLEAMELGMKDIMAKNTIQEPTLRSCIVIYKKKNSPAMFLKMFRDIPMADMEVLYPEKKLRLSSTDTVSLVATVIAALSTLVTSAQSEGLSMYMFLSVMIGLAMIAARIFLIQYNAKYYYDSILTKTLYDKQQSSNEAMILSLVHSSEEQEVKEAVLGYFFLLKHGAMTPAALDAKCEDFLSTRLHEQVDFEVTDSLRKLVGLKLATQSGTGADASFEAVPLPDAVAILDSLWDNISFDGEAIEE